MKRLFMITALATMIAACNGGSTTNKNPFFSEYDTPFGVPPFDQIKMEHYKPAFLKGIKEQKAEIAAIVNQRSIATFENTIAALDSSGQLLQRVSAVFYGLNSAETSDSMEALGKELSPILSAHFDDIALNPQLFARVKEVYGHINDADLTKEQKKLLENTYKDFVRNGANLPDSAQSRLRELNSQISLLQLTFGQNMLKETNDFRLVIDKKEDLAGLPDNLIAAASEAAGEAGKWAFTLHNPSIMPFLQFSERRELRKKILEAYLNRGNNGNDADNNEVVKQLVTLRLEKAKLLGYADYASYALDNRMAKNEEAVYSLLNQVWEPALVAAQKECDALTEAMHKDGVSGDLQSWDWSFYNEKVKAEKFDLDENQLRPYLKLENVRDGMFKLAYKLYGISFNQVTDIPVPHEEAQAFCCKDSNGNFLGILYLDFFPRPGKRGGAWCGTYRDQSYNKEGERIAPVVSIVCNFSRPTEGNPALLSADEASTMFHEFGHALHNLFSDVHYYGTGNVPRDFVELPSQVMEHWVFEPDMLKLYAFHYKSGEPIPADLVSKMKKAGKWGQGFATAEFLEASFLDMDFHVLKEIPKDFSIAKFEANSMKHLHALPQIPPRYRSTYFNHTMGGGYTAGYYSYLWAEVLDADAYNAYVETGDIFNQTVATRFRKYILTPGGIDDAMDMYVKFRGRKPGVEPLLENRGLK